MLLVRSHQAEIIIVKCLIQGRNGVTRVWIEPRLFNQGRRKQFAFTHLAKLPIILHSNAIGLLCLQCHTTPTMTYSTVAPTVGYYACCAIISQLYVIF